MWIVGLALIIAGLAWLGFVYMEVKDTTPYGQSFAWNVFLKASWWALIPVALGITIFATLLV